MDRMLSEQAYRALSYWLSSVPGAARMVTELLSLIADPEREPFHAVLDTELVLRESSLVLKVTRAGRGPPGSTRLS